MVLVYRVAQPVWRSLRHQLRVVEVRQEAPGVVSVVCQGRHLDRLAVSGGQFFHWHFLTKEMWWQGHPYSLSALPRPPYIRVTIKGLGDQSRAAASLRPGTRVAIEGPYGTFTDHARLREGVALFAAGVGITPVRALLEDLPAGVDVVVVVRASTPADLVHRDEVAALVRQRRGRLQEIVGSRHKVRLNARVLRSARARHRVPRRVHLRARRVQRGDRRRRAAARDGRGADPHRDVRVLMPGRGRQQMRSSEGRAP